MSTPDLPNLESCPPGSPDHLYVRTLHAACQKLGSIKALARHLKLSPAAVLRMLDGSMGIPQAVFLHAVDIIVGQPDQSRSKT
jgi:hypothetical protein